MLIVGRCSPAGAAPLLAPMCVCVCACARARVRACVRAGVCQSLSTTPYLIFLLFSYASPPHSALLTRSPAHMKKLRETSMRTPAPYLQPRARAHTHTHTSPILATTYTHANAHTHTHTHTRTHTHTHTTHQSPPHPPPHPPPSDAKSSAAHSSRSPI